jgi:chromosome segregation ATPase
MAKPIATPATVFAACEQLDAANERWNREDVRQAVGGGGFVVIDPLIRAWRELKPLREAAPSTPAELLHQVATSLEAHLQAFTAETDQRVTAQQQVFETTVADLAERLAGLEATLEDTTARLASAEAANGHLNAALTARDTELTDAQKTISHLTVENDSFKGQIARQDKAHAVAMENLQGELRSQAQQHERAGARWREAQAAALAAQRQELIATAEQAENRWMKQLDEARQEARASVAVSTKKLNQAADALQRERGLATALKSRVGALETENAKLEQALARQTEATQHMTIERDQHQQQAAILASEFADYKEAYQLGSELDSLKDAVAALQQQMRGSGKKPDKPAL